MDYGNDGGGGGNFGSPGGMGSPSGDAPRRRATDEQTLIPVTISMLLKAPEFAKLDDGREPHQVKLVAAVRDVNKGSTAYTYTVEDGTGVIEVKEWLDDGNFIMSKIREEAAVDHQYVRIIGKLEQYEGNPQIVAHAVRKVTSGNELTHHFLEVIHEAETHARKDQIVGTPSQSMQNMSFSSGGMHTSTPLGMDAGGGDGDKLTNEITDFLSKLGPDVAGGNVFDFLNQCSGQYTEDQVREKFEALAGDGLIYSTIDENHYRNVE